MPTAKNGPSAYRPSAQGRWGPRWQGGAGSTYADGFVVDIYWTRVIKKILAGRPSVGTSWEQAEAGATRTTACPWLAPVSDTGRTAALLLARPSRDGSCPRRRRRGWNPRRRRTRRGQRHGRRRWQPFSWLAVVGATWTAACSWLALKSDASRTAACSCLASGRLGVRHDETATDRKSVV